MAEDQAIQSGDRIMINTGREAGQVIFASPCISWEGGEESRTNGNQWDSKPGYIRYPARKPS